MNGEMRNKLSRYRGSSPWKSTVSVDELCTISRHKETMHVIGELRSGLLVVKCQIGRGLSDNEATG